MLPRHGHYVGEWTPRMQWDISRGNFTLHKCDNQDTMDVLTNPWRGTWNTSQRKAQWETIACHIKNKELRCRLLDRIAVTKYTIQENRDYGCNGTYCKGTANYTRAPILTPKVSWLNSTHKGPCCDVPFPVGTQIWLVGPLGTKSAYASALTSEFEGHVEQLPSKGTTRDWNLHCQVRIDVVFFRNVSFTQETMQENQNCEWNESFCIGTSLCKNARKHPNLLPFWRFFERQTRLQPGGPHFKWTPKRMHILDSHPRPRHLINWIVQCPHLSTQQTIYGCATTLSMSRIGVPPSMIQNMF